VYQSLSLGENYKGILINCLVWEAKLPEEKTEQPQMVPQAALEEKCPIICVFLQEAGKLGARADPQGKLKATLGLDTSGPFPPTLLSLFSE
jgi:hypothetical protein